MPPEFRGSSQIPSAQTINLSSGIDSGSLVIGDTLAYANFTPTSETVAGALRGIDQALGQIGGSKTDKFVLNGTDVSNKFVTLSYTPITPGSVILLVEDASSMFYGTDFIVIGNQLGWSGLALDGLLSSGDSLTVVYSV